MNTDTPIYQAAIAAVQKVRAANPDIVRGVTQAATQELRQRCLDQLMMLAWIDGAEHATIQALELLGAPSPKLQAL